MNRAGGAGKSHTVVNIQDIEVQAVLLDQEAVQKLIDKLTMIKGLLPEKKEAAN
jgi:hypothetical protein